MIAKVAVPRHKIDALLAQSSLQEIEERMVDNRYAAIVDWDWDPDSAERVRSATGHGTAVPATLYRAVLADLDDADVAVVYFYIEDFTAGKW
jgi:hypothetical protein